MGSTLFSPHALPTKIASADFASLAMTEGVVPGNDRPFVIASTRRVRGNLRRRCTPKGLLRLNPAAWQQRRDEEKWSGPRSTPSASPGKPAFRLPSVLFS